MDEVNGLPYKMDQNGPMSIVKIVCVQIYIFHNDCKSSEAVSSTYTMYKLNNTIL